MFEIFGVFILDLPVSYMLENCAKCCAALIEARCHRSFDRIVVAKCCLSCHPASPLPPPPPPPAIPPPPPPPPRSPLRPSMRWAGVVCSTDSRSSYSNLGRYPLKHVCKEVFKDLLFCLGVEVTTATKTAATMTTIFVPWRDVSSRSYLL